MWCLVLFIPVQKLWSSFNINDEIPFQERHGFTFQLVCATENCNANYIGECAIGLQQHEKVHNFCNHSSHLVNHAVDKGHLSVQTNNFEEVTTKYYNNTYKIKTAEALLVTKLNKSLNIQEKSICLKMFNWQNRPQKNPSWVFPAPSQ